MEDTKDGPFRGLSANPQSLNHDSRTAVCTYDQPDAGHSTGLSRDSAPRARGQSSHSRDFEFVLVTDDQSRRQVRRHAMREHTRQRRLNSIARLETSAPISGWAFRASSNHLQSPSLTIEDAKDGSLACNDITSRGEAPAVDDGTESLPLVSSNRVKREDDSPSPTILRWPCDPHTSPALDGVLDPFDSYPIPIEQADRGLIEHCKCSCLLKQRVSTR